MLLSDEEIEGLMRGRSTLDFGKAVQAAILAKLASAELPEPEVFDGSYLKKNGEWEFEDGYTDDQLTAWGNTRYAQGAAAQLDRLEKAEKRVDALLHHCHDDECLTCGEIICPHGEPMHFHHDGCPACAQHEAMEASK